MDGIKYELGPKVHTVLLILSLIPFGLVGVGGALGGLCGGVGWGINQAVLRTTQPTFAKVLIMLGVTIVAGTLWFVLAMSLRTAIA